MPVRSPVGSWNSIGRIVSTNRIELQERRCIKGQSRGKIKKFFTWFCTKTIIIIIKRIFHLSDNSWLKFCDHLPRANWIDFLPYNCFFSKQQIFFSLKKEWKLWNLWENFKDHSYWKCYYHFTTCAIRTKILYCNITPSLNTLFIC